MPIDTVGKKDIKKLHCLRISAQIKITPYLRLN